MSSPCSSSRHTGNNFSRKLLRPPSMMVMIRSLEINWMRMEPQVSILTCCQGSWAWPPRTRIRSSAVQPIPNFVTRLHIMMTLPSTELNLHSNMFLCDTSSSGLSWFFWLLTTHRHVEHAICTEIEDIVRTRDQEESDEDANPMTAAGSTADFTFEELKRMHYLHAAVTESLRLYPPVPVDVKVALHADVWPDGTRVAANSGVAYHPFAMGRMERIWGADCCEFKPERWLVNGIFVQESPYKFAVFQAGPRMCLGKELAMIQMKMIAASVLQQFTFSMPDGFLPKYGLNLTMPIKNGLPVWVHPRHKN